MGLPWGLSLSRSPLPAPAPPAAASPCQVWEQNPAAGKINSPILHANGIPTPSRFPSIYFWALLEKKKKIKSLLPNSWGGREGGRLQHPSSPVHPRVRAEPMGASSPGRGVGPPDSPACPSEPGPLCIPRAASMFKHIQRHGAPVSLPCGLDVVNLGVLGAKLGSPILPEDEGLRGAHREPP